MSRKSSYGVITKPKRDKPRKRPGRHKKKRNKHEKRMVNIGEKVKKGVDKDNIISYIYRMKEKRNEI